MEIWYFQACNNWHKNKFFEPFSFGRNVLLCGIDWENSLSILYIWMDYVSWKRFRKMSNEVLTLQILGTHLCNTMIRYTLHVKKVLFTCIIYNMRKTQPLCTGGNVQHNKEDRNVKITNMLCHILFKNNSFVHIYIHCLGHFSPPAPCLLSLSLTPSLPGRTCSAFFCNSVVEKT
jgi:hypothetical protein